MKKDVYELTNPQKSIWLTEEFYKGTAINNIGGNLLIREKVDFEKFKTAINLFIKTNESFRLKFFIDGSTPKQYVSDYEPFDIEIIDLNSEEDLLPIEKKYVYEPLPLLNTLLFKFKLVRFTDGSGGFLICAHHLISDAATYSVLAPEIVKIYSSLISNTEFEYNTNLYTNYIKSEQEYLQSEKFKKDEAYWNALYKEVPEIASIPSLVKSNNETLNTSLRETFIISKEIFEKANEVCKENRISSFNLFMAIYAIYLGRVSNLDEFVVGTPILNRTNFVEKNTSGMFISTAPFKITLNHELSFADFAKNIATDSLSMLRHQKYPYQFLLENLRKNGSPVPNLYDFMFSYQITKAVDKTIDVPYTTHWLGTNTIANSIEVHAHDNDSNGTVTIAYDYKTEKYTKEDITNLHNRILCILKQIIDNPKVLLKDIEIVLPEEKHKILYEFNNTKVDYPKDKTIVELFEEQVEKTPDNIAVVFEDQKLTYKELNEKANQLAWYLREQKITRNNIIGIMLDRSIEMIIAILAVLKSGACYIPIDPDYPSDRVSYMLENSNTLCLISRKHLVSNINFFNKILDVDLILEKLKTAKNDNLESISKPDDLSYIIYTSGSTGKPKGVMLKHKSLTNLTNYCNNYVEYLKNNSYKTIVSITTVSFDIFIFETLISLQKGLKLVIANEDEQVIPRLLNNLIEKENIEIIQTTPSRMQLLLNNYNDIPALTNLKYITLAGEQLPLSLKNDLHSLSGATIYNGYGPSETTVFSTYTDVTNHSQITIGKPLDNTQIYILDKNLKPCPIGVSGEIYISGDGVGLGYMNNLELTKKSYLENPLIPNTIMYKTGDLGIFKENGEIICLGRCDNQVKIRGLRIELEEIESKISEVSNISNCVVLKKTTSDNHEFLCAYYTKSGPVNIDNIRKHLSKVLPNYMVPQYFVELEELPYTPNGKIDKKALPEPVLNTTLEVIPSRNEIDSKLIKIFEELFNTKNLGINYSFFDIGGDSLSAINLSTRIFNTFNIQVTVKDILNNPIISDLSDFISKANAKKLSIIPKADEKEFYPVSSAQKRIYYSCKVSNDGTTYNMPGGLILSEMPDIEKLEKCFNEIIEKHETLRTYFDVIGGEVVQKIKEKVNFKIDFDEEICTDKYFVFTNFVKPFDLSKAPLLRAKLVKLENEKALLLFDMHHIISDGTSIQILINELCGLYNGDSLSPLEITYKDYSVWEQNNLKENKLKEAQKFWVNQFKDDIPVLNLPTNHPRPTVQSFEGSNIYKELDKDLTEKIKIKAKKLNITPYMLLLSCYYILLYKYTSNEDIIVGTPIVGRDNSQLNNIIGMFVNSLPLRKKIDSNETFIEFTNSVKELCLNSFEHQTYPFDELVSKLNVKRDSSRNPLFDTMFIYQNEGNTKVNLGNIKSKYYIPDSNISKFDLSLEVVPKNNKLNLRFEYATKLFNKEFIEYLSIHYINILKTILENNTVKIADIEMLSEEEKHKILYEFNNTKVDYPKDKTIVELFEEQVAKTPNNIAVVFEDQKLTYRELNEKANEIAHLLIKQGIKNEDIICLLLDKSLEMIISIVGVLKAGCAFLPIDVYYPKDRIDYMIRDSKSQILLTTKEFINKSNSTIKTICIDLDDTTIYNNSSINNLSDIQHSSNNLAYVMYTSGSTGNPKGVMIEQKSIIRLVKNTNYIKFAKKEKILQTGSIVFDACTFEIWSALLNGFELYLIKKETLLNSSLLQNYLLKHNITILWLTAPLFNQLVEENPHMFNKVKYLLTGGDVLSPRHINMAKTANPNLTIVNGYGPTENTTFSTCFTIDKKYKSSIPIGYPISNSTCYIVSNSGLLQPIGCPGELWVGGDGVGRGYLNNEDLTKEKFVNSPFSNGKLYKTGDLTRWLPNGQIEFMGRIDSQVKIRGFRIELEEINVKISNYPNIKEVTTVIQNINDEKTICSYIVSDENIDITDLKLFLKQSLPSYMIPSYFMQLKKLPINTNGKIDKSALPTDFKLKHTASKIVKPTNKKETILLDIFKKILNTEEIGITDNFFDMGGDSLLAMKVQVEALSNNLNINYADIFQYPTVKDLVKSLNTSTDLKENEDVDYSKYNKLLKKNCISNIKNIKHTPIGNVLLTGFTGFLGAHVLDSFIKKEKGNIYCLIRSKNNMTAEERLKNVLHFYFDEKYDKYIGNRIRLVEGDITLDNLGLSNQEYNSLGNNVQSVIHCAALVKHYGTYKDFEKINIFGTQKIIELCQRFSLRLLHISTISVSGNAFAEGSYVENNFTENINYDETKFYIGQNLKNLYIRSKFKAEQLVFDAIDNGLEACILRMGNLTSRATEGKFQQNHFENAFVNRFKSILQIKYAPDYLLSGYVEFTPIDYCGDAIIKLCSNFNKDFTVFHLLNDNHVNMDKLFNTLKSLNIDISIVSSEKFIDIINSILQDETKKSYLEGIINDFNENKELVYESPVKIKSDFTKKYLKQIGFKWPYINKKYIKNYLKYLADIGYFNIEIN